ncbi:MAG: lamin tail domain-containing protein [bacterium]|nr:lamin tail domain-containing protein [bacterium]
MLQENSYSLSVNFLTATKKRGFLVRLPNFYFPKISLSKRTVAIVSLLALVWTQSFSIQAFEAHVINVTASMVNYTINGCTPAAKGEVYLYEGDPFASIETSFVAKRDQLLIFTRPDYISAADFEVMVDGATSTKAVIFDETLPFPVKVYAADTTPGATVSIEGSSAPTSDRGARAIQGYVAQDKTMPVYDTSDFNVIISLNNTTFSGNRYNELYLGPGTYSALAFDKYSQDSPVGPDADELSVRMLATSTTDTIFETTYIKPFPIQKEGAILRHFDVSATSTYGLLIDGDESVYWPVLNCPSPPENQCVGEINTVSETISKVPDAATLHNGTDVTALTAVSDDARAFQDVVDEDQFIYLDWTFNDIPADAVINEVNLTLEHRELGVAMSVEWWNGSEWVPVWDPAETTNDLTETESLLSFIDTPAEAGNVQLRLRLVKAGQTHGDVDYAFLEIKYEHNVCEDNEQSGVVINEVMWMGSYDDNFSTADEWIELRNLGSSPVEIGRWYIENAGASNGSIIIPTGASIPAGGYYLIANYLEDDSNVNVTVDYANSSVSLADDYSNNGALVLKNLVGDIIDQTPAAVGATWPEGLKASDPIRKWSMERNLTPDDGTQTSNWHTCDPTIMTPADLALMQSYWDAGAQLYNCGTPGAANLSKNDSSAPDYDPEAVTATSENFNAENSEEAVVDEEDIEENLGSKEEVLVEDNATDEDSSEGSLEEENSEVEEVIEESSDKNLAEEINEESTQADGGADEENAAEATDEPQPEEEGASEEEQDQAEQSTEPEESIEGGLNEEEILEKENTEEEIIDEELIQDNSGSDENEAENEETEQPQPALEPEA